MMSEESTKDEALPTVEQGTRDATVEEKTAENFGGKSDDVIVEETVDKTAMEELVAKETVSSETPVAESDAPVVADKKRSAPAPQIDIPQVGPSSEAPRVFDEKEAGATKESVEAPTQKVSVVKDDVAAAKQALPTIKGAQEVEEEEPEEVVEEEPEEEIPEEARNAHIYALRTTANREDQVLAFVSSNAGRKKLGVYSVVAPHGMRGYIFLEAVDRHDAEQAAFGVPYAKGLLPNEIGYEEIEHMLEQVKKDVNIQKNDIAEILSGPFKREKCKIARVDKVKEEVVVELLEAAVPIPITLKIDSVKVIRRDKNE